MLVVGVLLECSLQLYERKQTIENYCLVPHHEYLGNGIGLVDWSYYSVEVDFKSGTGLSRIKFFQQ